MKKLDLRNEVTFHNAAEVVYSDEGALPLRFPEKTLSTFEPVMERIARMQTALELRIPGHLSKVRITARLLDSDGYGLTGEWYTGEHKLLPVQCFSRGNEEYTFEAALSTNIIAQWNALPVRFLFPTHCTLLIKSVEVEVETAERPVFHMPPRKTRWILHGDSISQGANCSTPSCAWSYLLAQEMGLDLVNLSIGGYGKAEPEMAAYLATRTDGDFMTLHIGANMRPSAEAGELVPLLLNFIRRIRQGFAKPIIIVSPILVLTKLGGRCNENHPLWTGWMEAFTQLQREGDEQLYFIDGRSVMKDQRALLSDGLHLNDYGQFCYLQGMLAALDRPLQTILKS